MATRSAGQPVALSAAMALLVAGVTAAPEVRAQGVVASSYLGGHGDDHITAVAFASDGTLRLAGDSTSTDLGGPLASRLAPGNGFVAAVSRDGTTLLWLRWLEPVQGLVIAPDDTLVLRGARHLLAVDHDARSIVWTGPDLGAATADLTRAPDGDLGVVAGTTVFRFAADGTTQRFRVAVGRSRVAAVAADPRTGDFFVSGDQNTSPCGPWRSPYVYRYDATGTRTARLYDFPGSDPNVCTGARLLADAHVDWLGFDPDGTGWFTGSTDGGDTVFTRDPASTATPLAGLVGACLATPCYGWVGANNAGFAARFTDDRMAVARASFFVAHFSEAPAACTCDVPNPGGAVRANSAGLNQFHGFADGVVGVGASAYRWPVTSNAWYPHTAYTPGYPTVVGVLDRDLHTMRMATMLPGTGSPTASAFRGGRLVVVGNAPDNSAYVLPSTEPGWLTTVPAFPSGRALQPGYGGGTTDGFLYVACVTTPAECDAPVPDAGVPDAGTTDAGTADAAMADAGVADAGVADVGLGDVTLSDGGTPGTDVGTAVDVALADSAASNDTPTVTDTAVQTGDTGTPTHPPDAATPGASTGGSGCGCAVPLTHRVPAGTWVVVAALSAIGRRRRRHGPGGIRASRCARSAAGNAAS